MHLAQPVGSGLWFAAYERNDGTEGLLETPAPWKRLLMHHFPRKRYPVSCPSWLLAARSERVVHPNVRLPVAAAVALAVDRQGGKPAGKPIVGGLWEGHPCPLLPVRDAASDPK